MNAPLTRKNFAKMGVDLEKEMAKAAKAGMTPIEAIAEITNRTLKGNLGRLGDLFSDAQVQQGLRPLIQNMELYRQIRAEAMAAQGVVEEDYQRRLQTGAMATQRWAIAMEGLNLAIGNALLPTLTSLANSIIPIVNKMAEWTEKHPALTRAIVATTAGIVALRVAALAARFSLLWLGGGLLSAGAGALRILAAAVTPVVTAMRVLTLAVAGTGIGAILIAIAMAGAWIYNNWSGIATMFEAFKGAFMRAIEPVLPILEPVIAGFSWLWDTISGLLGPIDELGGGWARAGLAAGKFVGDTIVAIVELPGKIAQVIRDMIAKLTAFGAEMAAAGKALMNSLLEGIKAGAAEVLNYVTGIGSQIKNGIAGAASGAWNSVKSAVGLGGESPAMAGTRAAGGPVRAGGTYLVGEKGPELVTFARNAFVNSAAATARMARNAALASAVAMPAAASGQAAQSSRGGDVNMGGVTIHVTAAPGQSPEAIASAVEVALSRKLTALYNGAHHDGVH